jgi:hypothetical protein
LIKETVSVNWRVLWIGILLSAATYGQDLRAIAQSPFSIRTWIQTHQAFPAGDLWKALGIPELLSDPYKDLARGFDCQADPPCEVWSEPVPLPPDGSRGIALRFTRPGYDLNRFLIFRREGAVWRLAGYIDSNFAKYFDPILCAKQLGGRWWLVVQETSGSGTGFLELTQRWFETRDGQLQEVLSILDDSRALGYPGEFIVHSSATVMDFQRTGNGDLMRVLFRLAFTLAGNDGVDRGFFGSIERTAEYRRRGNESRFGPGASEIAGIFRPGPRHDLATEFVRYDLQNLLKIAAGPDSIERQWLARNLKSFPASSERDQILRKLDRGRSR